MAEVAVKVKPYREIVGDTLKLNMHIGQARAWDSIKRFIALLGGRQSGKTCFAPDWMEREIRRRGPGDYLAVTATFPLLNMKMLDQFRIVFEDVYHWGQYKESHGSRFIIFNREKKQEGDAVMFEDKDYEEAGVKETRIIFGSATNPESLESATAKAAVLDECLAPETLINTEFGLIPIGEIVNRQLHLRVWSFDTCEVKWGLRPIVRWVKLPQRRPLLNIGGLHLTGNHKVLTRDSGYILADDLIASAGYAIMKAEVIKDDDVRKETLRGNTPEDERIGKEAFRGIQCQTFSEFEEAFSGTPRTQGSNSGTTEEKIFQSRESPLGSKRRGIIRPSTSSKRNIISEYAQDKALAIRRKCTINELEAGEAGESIGVGERIRGDNREGMASTCLQDRCRRTEPENSDRSRECRQPRQEAVVHGEWLDISSFLQQNGGDLDGGLSRDSFVYNLEVEENHNYIANGILVSNCGQKQFRRDSWDAVRGRVALYQGRVLLTTSLYSFGWLKDEVYDEWERGNPDFDVIQIDSIVNPSFSVEEYKALKDTMPAWKFDLNYRGIYSKPAGMVYDCFDSANAVVDPFEIPESWPVYVGHDFGSNNMAALWFAQDPATGYLYIFQEYLSGGRATFEHIEKWKEMSEGLRIIKRVGGAHHEDGWRGDFTQAGWRIDEPTERGVAAGIQQVYGLIKTGKLFAFRTVVNWLDEINSYSYELDEQKHYQPTEKIENKERYHLMDCMRAVGSDFNPVDVNRGKAPVTVRSQRH